LTKIVTLKNRLIKTQKLSASKCARGHRQQPGLVAGAFMRILQDQPKINQITNTFCRGQPRSSARRQTATAPPCDGVTDLISMMATRSPMSGSNHHEHNAALDGLRGFAAFTVVAFHVHIWQGTPFLTANSAMRTVWRAGRF
jgi:hypothetical protein